MKEECPNIPASIVDKHIDGTDFVLDTRYRCVDSIVVGDIDGVAFGSATCGF
ncbi:hypothetical protein D3C86_2179190 [compost metagenome]